MTTRPRKAYDIDSLTDVALEVFARKGFDGASMDDVAAAAGITKAAIYHHVAGKEMLLERGLERAVDALFGILAEPGATRGKALQRLRYIVRRVARTTLDLLPELSVLFRVRGNSPVERRAIERRREFDRIVAALIVEGQQDGELRGDVRRPPRDPSGLRHVQLGRRVVPARPRDRCGPGRAGGRGDRLRGPWSGPEAGGCEFDAPQVQVVSS